MGLGLKKGLRFRVFGRGGLRVHVGIYGMSEYVWD